VSYSAVRRIEYGSLTSIILALHNDPKVYPEQQQVVLTGTDKVSDPEILSGRTICCLDIVENNGSEVEHFLANADPAK
jgi:hypothetical protein